MAETTETLADLAPVYQKIAIKWMMWDLGKTADEAKACLEKWPDHGDASNSVDVATFIVDECNGR